MEQGAAAGRPPRLLVVYGLVEAGIGIYVFLFPRLFRGVQALSLWVPHGSAGLGFVFDVALAAVLIGPPTVLMGGTIPILTQALARCLADATRFHAFVYAFNTAGAFVGALAAGFFLIPELGLVRVMYAMGAVNLGAGAIFLYLGWRRRTDAVKVSECLATLKELEVAHMNTVINTMLAFMSNADAEVLVEGVIQARLLNEEYRKEKARLLGEEYVPPPTQEAGTPTASGTETVLPSATP